MKSTLTCECYFCGRVQFIKRYNSSGCWIINLPDLQSRKWNHKVLKDSLTFNSKSCRHMTNDQQLKVLTQLMISCHSCLCSFDMLGLFIQRDSLWSYSQKKKKWKKKEDLFFKVNTRYFQRMHILILYCNTYIMDTVYVTCTFYILAVPYFDHFSAYAALCGFWLWWELSSGGGRVSWPP